MVIAFVTRFLPIAFTNSNSAIQGLHPELEEAVRISGGNQARALWMVVLPLLKKSLFGSWLLIFIIFYILMIRPQGLFARSSR